MSLSQRSIRLTLPVYVAIIVVVGTILAAVVIVDGRDEIAPAISATTLLLVFGVLIGELFPIRVYARGTEGEVTMSSTFAMALLIAEGPAVALVGTLLARLAAELILRKPPYKYAFNLGQTAISLALASIPLAIAGDVPRPGPRGFIPSDLPTIVAALAVFFASNSLLVGKVLALVDGVSLRRYLSRSWWSGVATSGLLLGLSPIVVIVLEFWPPLIALLAMPLYAIHRGGSEAIAREHDSLHDPLTGLPNRVLFFDRVEQALHAGRRSALGCVVMVLDLDGFKEINDSYGHYVGDGVLRVVAERLVSELRAGDTVARLGGDEFVVLLHPGSDAEAAEVVANSLCIALEQPLQINGLKLSLSASIGIAHAPAHGDDVDTLVGAADHAMYQAKAAGGGYAMFRPFEPSPLTY